MGGWPSVVNRLAPRDKKNAKGTTMTVRTILAGLALAVLALPATAQSIAGKWNGNVDSPQGPFLLTFSFMVESGELTGSMSNDFMGEIPISDGMIDGNAVSFRMSFEGGPGGSMTVAFSGELEGDELTLTPELEGDVPPGGGGPQPMTLTRAD